jgi:hypothetical protein
MVWPCLFLVLKHPRSRAPFERPESIETGDRLLERSARLAVSLEFDISSASQAMCSRRHESGIPKMRDNMPSI